MKLMTITFDEVGDEVTVAMDFHAKVPVSQLFDMAHLGISGLYGLVRQYALASGLTEEQFQAALFSDGDIKTHQVSAEKMKALREVTR